MRPENFDQLPVYHGLHFDPATGRMYREDGADTTFTFERASWTGPFGLHFAWPWLNPLAFATAETAARVLAFSRSIAPAALTVAGDDTKRVVGPFTRTVERLVQVSDGSTTESFSAGWMANTIIRQGEERAADSFRAEWRQAGLKF